MHLLVAKSPISSSLPFPHRKNFRFDWHSFLLSPLWICLLVGVLVRVFLILHTHGVLAGDEAVTGLQAEYILRGARPVYYYGQAYMGSLEAYLIAFVFVFTGPSVLTLRLAMMLVSLVLVILTWRFAAALTDEAQIPLPVKKRFMFLATLIAALPPLYDTVLELRSLGGYIEAMVLMLWLLLSALRLTQRWRAGASHRELLLRWLGIGFLLGLGFWVDPLVIYAVVAVALWIGCFVLSRLITPHRSDTTETPHPRLTLLQEAFLALVIIPGALMGAASALYWGSAHRWENVAYVFQNGGTTQNHRLSTIYQVQALYTSCLAPRVIGGTLPTEPFVTQNHPHLLTPGLLITGTCLLIAIGGIMLSLFWHHPTLVRLRHLTLFPFIFCVCTSVIYCLSSISTASLYANCGPWDLTGRYVVPLIIAIPYFLAAVVTLLWTSPGTKNTQSDTTSSSVQRGVTHRHISVGSVLRQVLLVGILLVYFSTQADAYVTSDPHNTFQTSGCVSAPGDDTPIITYMQQHHIRYALATDWIGDPLTFKTDTQLVVAEFKSRLPGESERVLQSKRYSLIVFANHDGPQPPILHILQEKHIRYAVKRFFSVPRRDVMIITPLDQTIPITDPDIAHVLQSLHDLC
jgi:hypothetical protein